MEDEKQQTVAYIDGNLKIRPAVDRKQIKSIVKECFGLNLSDEYEPKELVSYDDRNFIVKGTLDSRNVEFDSKYSKSNKFVLKIFNSSVSGSSQHYEDLCQQLLLLRESCSDFFKVPLPVETTHSDDFTLLHSIPLSKIANFEDCTPGELAKKHLLEKDGDGYVAKHLVRLSVFIEGIVKDEKEFISEKYSHNLGICNGLLNKHIQNTRGPNNGTPGVNQVWDLINCADLLKETYLQAIQNDAHRQLCLNVITEFQDKTLSILDEIERTKGKSWIHNDVNDQNIVLNDAGDIVGVLDFDDVAYSYEIVDMAISMMYVAVGAPPADIIKYLRLFYQGYVSVRQVTALELSVLFNLCLMRFVQSGAVSAYQYAYLDPGNDYLLQHGSLVWGVLSKLLAIGEEEFLKQVTM